MNNSAALLRNLVIYAICVPLAMLIAYWLVSAADEPTRSSLTVVGLVVLALCAPILLRWHYPLLLFCWNLPLMLFFLPGYPSAFLPMLALSLVISILQRALSRNMRFIHAPQITLPLVLLMIVALFTAKMTGFGLHAMGSQLGGGKKYVNLFAGILAFFALTAHRIPPQRANLYVGLFFLPPVVAIVSDILAWHPLPIISLLFPPDIYAMDTGLFDAARFAGARTAGSAVFIFMLVRYGIHGIFLSGKLWRPIVLLFSFMVIFFGGFRSAIALVAMVFAIQFLLERLHRTKLLPIFIFLGMLGAVICLPFTNKLPYPVQRAIAFLPVKINPLAQSDAQGSLDWRLDMWQALLPEVPKHLLLGKGYAITAEDFEVMGRETAFRAIDPSQQGLALAEDYHSGPLSVILPLGIWGAIAFLWFLVASVWALHRNFRYGNFELKIINRGLFAVFLANIISFFFIVGDLASGMFFLTGLVGLSIALNHGICRPNPKPVHAMPATGTLKKRRLPGRPAFQH